MSPRSIHLVAHVRTSFLMLNNNIVFVTHLADPFIVNGHLGCFHILALMNGALVNLLLLLSCSVTSDSLRPHGLQHTRLPCPSLCFLQLMSIESVMPSNHLILCRPLLLLPSCEYGYANSVYETLLSILMGIYP